MNRHREYEPNECCVGCGRTVPASDMRQRHCPQCQEDVRTQDAVCFPCALGGA
jgi:predicted RNA-binding Zn-ribbon protein involved in translation (DUF1610 family)